MHVISRNMRTWFVQGEWNGKPDKQSFLCTSVCIRLRGFSWSMQLRKGQQL